MFTRLGVKTSMLSKGGDIMAAELVLLAKLGSTCFLIDSMVVICLIVLVFVLGTMATWRVTRISEFSSG